jgi:ADP-heptose:LPS heptosyltransferase
MQETKLPSNSQYVIVTVDRPVMFQQTEDEAWVLNPNRRYLINASRIPAIHQFVESVSELENGSLYNPLRPGKSVTGAKILVERFRERGIGDLLFLTGPLSYLYHISGANLQIDLFAFSDRGTVLTHAPFLHNQTVCCGPLEYDHLRMYNYHWLVGSVTECDEEADQLNVYDALFRQIGCEPSAIDARWKRPAATLVSEDYQHLDALLKWTFNKTKTVDLRRLPYYVVAPFSNASLRSAPYSLWFKLIRQLSQRRPVVVVGTSTMRLPDTDMSAGQFIQGVENFGGGVINLVDRTPSARLLMALVARAKAVVCLDSAPLYLAQATGTPAISLWGSHDPGARIGYDERYMRYALWNQQSCNCAPCYAYSQFPANKCPDGQRQKTCECLASLTEEQVLKTMDALEMDTSPTGLKK